MSKKVVLRSVFDKMSQRDRMAHCLSGGAVADDPAPPPPPPPLLAANQKLRKDFEKLTPAAQMAWFKGGGKIVDG